MPGEGNAVQCYTLNSITMKTENFAIAVFHFSIAYSSQKWTAVAWEALAVDGSALTALKR